MGIFNWGSAKKITALGLQTEQEKLSQKLRGDITNEKRNKIQADIDKIKAQIAARTVPELKIEVQDIEATLRKTLTYRLQAEIKALESTKLGLKNAGLDTKKIQSQINSKQKILEKELKNNKAQQLIGKLQSDLRSLNYLIENNLHAVANISDLDSELRKATNKQTLKLASQGRTITPTTRSESTPPPSPPEPTKSQSLLEQIQQDATLGSAAQVLHNSGMSAASGKTNNPPSTPKVNSLQKDKPGQER